MEVGNQIIDIGAERIVGTAAVIVAILLGEPPRMLRMDDALLDDGRHLRLHDALPELIDRFHPAAIHDALALGILGIDLQERVGIQLAAIGYLPVLGMEEGIRARTAGEDEGILLHELR